MTHLFWDFIAWTVSLVAKPLGRAIYRNFVAPVVAGPGKPAEDGKRRRT